MEKINKTDNLYALFCIGVGACKLVQAVGFHSNQEKPTPDFTFLISSSQSQISHHVCLQFGCNENLQPHWPFADKTEDAGISTFVFQLWSILECNSKPKECILLHIYDSHLHTRLLTDTPWKPFPLPPSQINNVLTSGLN